MGWATRIVFAGFVLTTGRVAVGAEVAADGFGPPVYDGVAADPQALPGVLRPYRFEGGREWPAIRLRAPRPLDWSRAGALTLEVENPGAVAVRLLLRIDPGNLASTAVARRCGYRLTGEPPILQEGPHGPTSLDTWELVEGRAGTRMDRLKNVATRRYGRRT